MAVRLARTLRERVHRPKTGNYSSLSADTGSVCSVLFRTGSGQLFARGNDCHSG
jgi:hypothetical protein